MLNQYIPFFAKNVKDKLFKIKENVKTDSLTQSIFSLFMYKYVIFINDDNYSYNNDIF